MRYQMIPVVMENGRCNIWDEALAAIWHQMVAEGKAQKVFYNGYIVSEYDFITFLKTGGVLPVLIYDTETKDLCHIAWISDYGEGHACLHHCSLGKFKRGAGKAILKYFESFRIPDTGKPTFEVLIGITPDNNEAAIRVAKLMGFKVLAPAVPMLCNDVYAGKRVNGVLSYYQYRRGEEVISPAEKGDETWVEERDQVPIP